VDARRALRQIPGVAPPRDPRYRPYRFALWVAYFLALLLSIGTLVANLAHHLSDPHRTTARGNLPTRVTLRVCVQELEALQKEQSGRAWRLADEVGVRDAVAAFDQWSRDWEQRVDDLSERCGLDGSDPILPGSGGRPELSRARDAVLALHRAYRAQVNRFAAEGADLARSATSALGEARRAVEPRP
jgi:hypothetical protein